MEDRSTKQLDFQTGVLIRMCLYLLFVGFFFLKTPRRRQEKMIWRVAFFSQGIHETKLQFSWVIAQVQNIYPGARHSKQIFLPPCRVFHVFCHHLRGWMKLFFLPEGLKLTQVLEKMSTFWIPKSLSRTKWDLKNQSSCEKEFSNKL